MMRTTRLLLALLSVVALAGAACGDDDDEAVTEPGQTAVPEATGAPGTAGDGVLRIGYLLPETGALDFLGPPMIEAVKMAVQEINDAGGVLGKPVELVGRDDGTDADVASTAADQLLAEGVDLIVGAAASGVSLAVIDKITTAGIPMCSPSNTGVQFSTYPDRDLYFRTAPPDNLQAQVLADLVVDDGHETLVVLGRSDEYGEGFANFVAEELESAGVTVDDVIIFDAEAGTYSDVATQIAAAAPDAVVMISFAEGGQIIKDAITAGVGPDTLQWYGADGIQSSTFYERVDPNDPAVVQGIRGTAPSAAPAGGEPTWKARFQVFAPGTDTIFSGHSYDCVALAALAATRANSDAPGDIAANITDVSRPPGETCTLVADCLEKVATDDIDYDGAAGPLDFVDIGEPGAGEYDTWEFDSAGSVVVIEESIPVAGEE
jgi:branched-chain amino acid transport system substrate-binding protein